MWWYKKTAMSCKTAIQTFISECLFLSVALCKLSAP
ncbi:MAG: hypothetical protein JWR72_363 [Flavisolibacter sp.]|nr:hypothetical protein [Flavisolibacter sp.]